MTREEQIGLFIKKSVEGMEDSDTRTAAAITLAAGIHWADQHPHWIPVEERLPEMYERVLVAGLDKRSKLKEPLLFVTCRAKEECGIKCDSNGFSVGDIPFAYKKVTHWMPLPEAPQGKENEI